MLLATSNEKDLAFTRALVCVQEGRLGDLDMRMKQDNLTALKAAVCAAAKIDREKNNMTEVIDQQRRIDIDAVNARKECAECGRTCWRQKKRSQDTAEGVCVMCGGKDVKNSQIT